MYPEITLGTTALSISTYFLVISLACILASVWFVRRAEARDLQRLTAIDFVITVFICGFIGARALHVFFEDSAFYASVPLAVFYVWNGGFVFLGGVVAALVAALVFCRLRHEPFWYWADAAAPPISLGYALGRLACLFNGCCYGKICSLPWAITLEGAPRHPTQAYASLWELGLLLLMLKFEKRFKTSGVLFNLWLIGHATGRILMEIFRDDPRGQLILGLSLGIWMSFGLAVLAATNLLSIQRS